MRRTKIICTLGPAVDNEEILKKLMLNGMDVARMNFSHGTHEQHKKRIDMFKRVRDSLELPIALLLDTKGPEIRTGNFNENNVVLKMGESFILTPEDIAGDNTRTSITYKELYKDVQKGNRILIDDGLIELEVVDIKNREIHCKVLNGGTLSNSKGINAPGVEIKLPSLTKQDIEDIRFGIENEIDFVAASFVRKAGDVEEIRKLLEKYKGDSIRIIAKIENRQGILNSDEILKVSDGIMIARGDLGVEIPVEEVPIVQKMLIEKCFRKSKPVITATQMLDSMIRNPRPTRAEASDVANAIYDGTSAVMLSGETAAGKYPVETLDMMTKIIEKAESSIDYWNKFETVQFEMTPTVTNAICHATCMTALDLNAASIIAVTKSGRTARMISRFRPECPIITITVSQRVQRQLSLSWGVYPYLVKEAESTDELFEMGVEKALESGLVKHGDLTVITAGVPVGISGTTNLLKVHIVGKVLVRGTGIGTGVMTGELCVANTYEDAEKSFSDGDILVLPYTTNNMLPVLKRASAIIVEENDSSNHASTVGLTLEIPVIIGAENATKILKNGAVVTVDADRGIVHCESTRPLNPKN